MADAFSRTEHLIGKAALARLKSSRVAVFGVGGVGSYAVEGLVRAGVGHLVLVDHDRVTLSNLNRQLIATRRSVGDMKVDVARDRILDINPDAQVEVHPVFFGPGACDSLVRPELDYIVDAMDTVAAKIELIVQAQKLGVPIISCMGAGNKMDPTRFEVADIYQTSVCPLSRAVRRELKKRCVERLKVVYSREEPAIPREDPVLPPDGADGRATAAVGKRRPPASISFVPSVAGLIIAAEVVRDLIRKVT